MRLSSFAIIAATFAAAAGLSYVAAGFAVTGIEATSERSVRGALDSAELPWAEVHADGLQVFLSGRAPSEALRFKAISSAGSIVDAARVIDQMQVKDSMGLAAPRFSIEVLRNDSGISLIGLVPADTDRVDLVARLEKLVGAGRVSDLLESADYPVPPDWARTVDYALEALAALPRSKISVQPGLLAVTGMADSTDDKRRIETDIARRAPQGLRLAVQISAPRPVITPFTLRFVRDAAGARFDACSADTEAAHDRIIAAATAAGMIGKASCTLGLGVPSPNWAVAVELAIVALARLGTGAVTFADADIALVATEGTDPALFDRVVGELENALPDVFALTAELPKPADQSAGPVEFTAVLSPEGQVQLRGRVADDLSRTATESLARARFGSDAVIMAARVDDTLPPGWPLRVLTGLEALTHVNHGMVTVTPDLVTVTGETGNADAQADIARLLVDRLGQGTRLDIQVAYLKKLDPTLGLPTPDDCEVAVQSVLAARKIAFEPGSAVPDTAAGAIFDEIAVALKRCEAIAMEIGGHTDSQGREEMNAALSQERATAVLMALLDRRVAGVQFTAVGYGEAVPIAENDSEAGRETNRRIEIRLIRTAAANPAIDALLEKALEGGAEDDGTDPATQPEGVTSPEGSGD
jgi:OOP family OmpA-OmpF porin